MAKVAIKLKDASDSFSHLARNVADCQLHMEHGWGMGMGRGSGRGCGSETGTEPVHWQSIINEVSSGPGHGNLKSCNRRAEQSSRLPNALTSR